MSPLSTVAIATTTAPAPNPGPAAAPASAGGCGGDDRHDRQSQTDGLLAWFRSGQAVTQEEARRAFGCTRLAARVWDLREAGYAIAKRMVRDDSGRLVAEYYLEEDP